MQHVEFFHPEHFENNYFRVPAPSTLSPFIDFFWETKFDDLFRQYPKGFSDAQFPNIGYTYIINLGTPYIMQVADKKFPMKTDGFLPRYNGIECFHKPGNHLFGIKFRISPVIFQKKIDFSEYRNYFFPLSYLFDQTLIDKIKKAKSFEDRIELIIPYFSNIITQQDSTATPVSTVSNIMDHCFQQNDFTVSLEKLASRHHISVRTLQRYFETCTGIGTKQALQVMRIRKAVVHLCTDAANFDLRLYGYYDHSHFYKHLKQFVETNTLKNTRPHLDILQLLHKKNQPHL